MASKSANRNKQKLRWEVLDSVVFLFFVFSLTLILVLSKKQNIVNED